MSLVDINTTTWQAATFGELEILRSLIDQGKSYDDQDDRGFSPLLWASRNGHHLVVSYLIEEKNCSVEKSSFGGLRPIHHACNKNHEKIVRILIKSGVDVNSIDDNGDTALHYAAARGILNIVIALLEAGADPSKANNQGVQPLHKATVFGQLAIVKRLGESNNDSKSMLINSTDSSGDTPLHYAAKGGFVAIVKCLLDLGANTKVENNGGYKPRDLAASTAIAQLFP
eukprot:gene19442-25322_t